MVDHTVAIVLPTAAWSWRSSEAPEVTPAIAREVVAREAMRWQELSAVADQAEQFAYPVPFRRKITWGGRVHVVEPRVGRPPREQNRILEIHGLMGAIGEQLGMAWTVEQDAQRVVMTADWRDALESRLILRAQSELTSHFVLGASHSVANLILRLMLLNADAAESLTSSYRVPAFPPGSEDRNVWRTFGVDMVRKLRRAASASGTESHARLVAALEEFRSSPAFTGLDGRRGLDYHRRRPQSVPHAAPVAGTVSTSNGQTSVRRVARLLQSEAEASSVYATATAALEELADLMVGVRTLIPNTIRSEGINYPFEV